jgi:hypothetical protein
LLPSLPRWRLFGDVSQERRVAAIALGWVGNVVVSCTPAEAASTTSGVGLWRSSVGAGGAKTRAPARSMQPHQLLLFPK